MARRPAGPLQATARLGTAGCLPCGAGDVKVGVESAGVPVFSVGGGGLGPVGESGTVWVSGVKPAGWR